MGAADRVGAVKPWPAARSSSAWANDARRQHRGKIGVGERIGYNDGGHHPAACSSSLGM